MDSQYDYTKVPVGTFPTGGIGRIDSAKKILPRQAPDFTLSVAEAEENVRVLRARIEALADKLCGSVPETDGAGHTEGPSAIFDIVAQHGHSINQNVARAREALDRIERSLP